MVQKKLTKAELEEEINRLEALGNVVDKTYTRFEYLRKSCKSLQELMFESKTLSKGLPEWDQILQLIETKEADQSDDILKPTAVLSSRVDCAYFPPELRQLSLEKRLGYILADSNSALKLLKQMQTSVVQWYSETSGGSDSLQPKDSETRHFLIGMGQFISRRIQTYETQLVEPKKHERIREENEDEQRQWTICNNLVELVNSVQLPLEEGRAEEIYDAFCTGKLFGSIHGETMPALREKANAEIIYAAIDALRRNNPDKALELAREIKDNDLRDDIYLKDINCPQPLVKLITAPSTNLAKRLAQYAHPIEFDFDASLVVLVGRNGTGKSSIMKVIAEFPDFSPREIRDGGGEYALSFTNHFNGSFDKQRQELTEQKFRRKKYDKTKDSVIFRPDFNGRFIASYVDMTGMYNRRLIQRSSSKMSAGQAQLNLIENHLNYIGWTGRYTGLMCVRAGVILLDEIGNQVDPINAGIIAEKLNNFTEDRQVVVATHNPNIVQNLRHDAILYSMNEVSNGMPVQYRIGDLDGNTIRRLMC